MGEPVSPERAAPESETEPKDLLEIPNDQFLGHIRNDTRSLDCLVELEDKFRAIAEDPEAHQAPDISYLSETIAVRRVLLLGEIEERLEQAKRRTERRIISTKTRAQMLREEYGIS